MYKKDYIDRKNKIKENIIVLAAAVISMLLIGWYVTVQSVNFEKKIEIKYFDMNEWVELNDISYRISEFKLYDCESIKKIYPSVVIQSFEKEDKFIIAKYEVINTGEEIITANYVMQNTISNFESLQWMSSISPTLVESINMDGKVEINPGETYIYYSGTNISPNCFSRKGWENIERESFDCVISLYPNPVRIKLGKPEVVR